MGNGKGVTFLSSAAAMRSVSVTLIPWVMMAISLSRKDTMPNWLLVSN